MPDKAYDRLTVSGKCCLMLVMSIIFPFVGTLFFLLFICCYEGEPNIHEQLKEAEKGISYQRHSYANQSWFACQAVTSCLYFKCPIEVDFIEKMSLAQAIRRHSDHNRSEEERMKFFLNAIQKNPYLEFVLRNINEKKPQFFFKILPSGSLKEGFGKMLPSTSVLATDYDMMLVPDAVHVQPTDIVVSYDGKKVNATEHGDGHTQFPIEEINERTSPNIASELRINMDGFEGNYPEESPLLASDDCNNDATQSSPPPPPRPLPPQLTTQPPVNDLQEEEELEIAASTIGEPAVFDALVDPTEEKKTMPDGFMWLKLNNQNLHQWRRLCYPRQHNKKTEFFLSQLAVYRELRGAIGTVKENKRFFERLTDADADDLDLIVEHNGPAVTVKVDQDEYQDGCCAGQGKQNRKTRAANQNIWQGFMYLVCVGLLVALVFIFMANVLAGILYLFFVGLPSGSYIFFTTLRILCAPCASNQSTEKQQQEDKRNLVKRKKLFECDFTLALHCPEFPKVAQKEFFESRKKGPNQNKEKVWPSPDVVKHIKRIGCHVVPKPSEKNLVSYTNEQQQNTYLAQSAILEWRFSFSQAEIIMAEQIHSIAREVYIAFKATIKRHINAVSVQGVYCKIPTYVLKSIFFRQVERKPLSYWEGKRDEVTEEFFILLFNTLKQDVENRKKIHCLPEEDQKKSRFVACPHYWLPRIDLLKDIDKDQVNFIQQRLQAIEMKMKYHVADNWLETQEFVRKSCCQCCYREEQNMAMYSRALQRSSSCCTIRSNGEPLSCGGPMSYNEEHFYVY